MAKKITKEQLEKIVAEELSSILTEEQLEELFSAKALGQVMGGMGKQLAGAARTAGKKIGQKLKDKGLDAAGKVGSYVNQQTQAYNQLAKQDKFEQASKTVEALSNKLLKVLTAEQALVKGDPNLEAAMQQQIAQLISKLSGSNQQIAESKKIVRKTKAKTK